MEKVIRVKKNGLGVAGFTLAVLGLLFCWVPIIGVALLALGALLSLLGLIVGVLGRKPLGFSIAGLLIALTIVLLSITVLQGVVEILNGL